jgi:antitoxin MazE
VVQALNLKEGDEVEITIAGQRDLQIDSRPRQREQALERLRTSGWTLPPGWKFKREELTRSIFHSGIGWGVSQTIRLDRHGRIKR